MPNKTFTAEQFNKHPSQVYRAADRDGFVIIKNAQYSDRVFKLTAIEKGKEGS